MSDIKKLEDKSLEIIKNSLDLGFEGVSFSGGKDSLLLLHLARKIRPDIPGFFVNTGAEDPSVLRLVKNTPNIIYLYPKMDIKSCIKNLGYPVFSKEISESVYQYRLGLVNRGVKLNSDFHFLFRAPFVISHRCCDELKKKPAHKYKLMIGNKISDSYLRKTTISRYGVINKNKAYPISYWNNFEVLFYLQRNNIKLPEVYKYQTSTGCIYCLFGILFDNHRFARLKKHQPKLWNHAMKNLGLEDVLRWLCDNCDDITLESCGLK